MIQLGGFMDKLEESLLKVLGRCELFCQMDSDEIARILEDRYTIVSFENGASVYTRSRFSDSVGIVLRGNVEVFKDARHSVMLNRICEGGFFGAAAVFAKKQEYVSYLIANKRCLILFIAFEDFRNMLETSSVFSLNYIRFLSGRIEFLNKKIDGFTACDAVEKLSLYIADNAYQEGDSWICTLPKSFTEFSKQLDMGRASLYRAFDTLQNRGCIMKDGRNIRIYDIDSLKGRGNVK